MEQFTQEKDNAAIGKHFESETGELAKIVSVEVSSRNLARHAVDENGNRYLVIRPGWIVNQLTEETYREVSR